MRRDNRFSGSGCIVVRGNCMGSLREPRAHRSVRWGSSVWTADRGEGIVPNEAALVMVFLGGLLFTLAVVRYAVWRYLRQEQWKIEQRKKSVLKPLSLRWLWRRQDDEP